MNTIGVKLRISLSGIVLFGGCCLWNMVNEWRQMHITICFQINMRLGNKPAQKRASIWLQSEQKRFLQYKELLQKYHLHNFFCLLLIMLVVVSTGCAGIPVTPQESPFEADISSVSWRILCPGVETADIYDARLPLIAHAVKIDLRNPSISIVSTEASRFCNTQGGVTGETTQEFAERLHTVAACNAAPFHASSLFLSRCRTVIGIHITEHSRMSAPNARYGALLFYADKTARIVDTQTEEDFLAEVCYAFGGYWTILRDGVVLPQKLEHRDSRTAVGLAADGTILILLAVEGEWKGRSQGLSYTETAVLLRALGASDALQFDGGSSSALVVREGTEQRLVSPSDGWNIHIPVASNLGIVYADSADVPH